MAAWTAIHLYRASLIVAPQSVQPFLTANWRYLAMLNYVVDPQVITPLVPAKLTSISKTALRDACSEYRVEHRRWKISSATDVEFNVDVATLYGEQFAEA